MSVEETPSLMSACIGVGRKHRFQASEQHVAAVVVSLQGSGMQSSTDECRAHAEPLLLCVLLISS